MREIKFRAWDKINKRWLNLWKILFEVTGEIIAVQDLAGEQYGLHQVDLLRYTGRKDKNGKEIYEEDITRWFSIKGPIIYAVRWSDDFCDDCGRGAGWESCPPDCEIIGNSYENPELIGK